MDSRSASAGLMAQHRQLFPALQGKAYFNYGGQGPMPQAALEALFEGYRTVQARGPFSQAAGSWATEVTEALRKAIAAELSVEPGTISLTENVSAGCNVALWGLDWRSGDHLLLSDCEHPGVVAAAYEVQRRFGVEVSVCPLRTTLNGGDPVAAVMAHVRPQTRLVVLSHVLWNTGQVLPLKAIAQACRQAATREPLRILVDAAQSVGAIPLDLADLGVDFYAFTGHKWCCGPEGVGGLYVRPEALESLRPTLIGWRGVMQVTDGVIWQPDGRRFEVATSAYPLYCGLRAAIAVHNQWGTARDRYERMVSLSDRLWRGLSKIEAIARLKTTPPEAGLVAFQLRCPEPDRQHPRLVQFLEAQHIYIRLIRDPNSVRACVHYFTTEDEIDQLLAAVGAFCASREFASLESGRAS